MARSYLSILLLIISTLTINGQTQRDMLSAEIEKYGQAEVRFEYTGFRTLLEIGKHISVDNIRDTE